MPDSSLLVIQGPDQGRRYEIGAELLHIGRGGGNQIRIIDDEASRRHAVISQEHGRWRLDDLGSSNGTYVNGKPVQTRYLTGGDQIQIGRTILLFDAASLTEAPAAGERISLVAQTQANDASRIVSHVQRQDTVAFSGWGQAGANLQLLYQISEEVVRPTASLDELLQRILDLTLTAVRADRGCMLVTNSQTDRIEPRVVSHRPHVNVDERMPLSTSIVEHVIQNGQGVRTSDAQHDSRFDGGHSIVKSGIREAMCVPMHGRYELMGVIYVDTTSAPNQAAARPPQGVFNDQLLRLLLAIGRQSALAVENSRYQAALIKSERLAAVGQTVAIMSHHVKNILQGMRGGGYLIDRGLKDHNEEMIRNGWGVLDRNQERIYSLIMDLLTFGKERQPKLAPAALGDVVNDVLELSRAAAQDGGIELLSTEVAPTPRSQFDAEGIHRAVLNLVTNAREAFDGEAQPRIEIRYGFDAGNDQIWLEVQDNGPGIDPETLPKLFTLFESSKGAKGTGLGLAVSRKILEEHGGKITVRTQTGEGTCFRLEWPYLPEHDDRLQDDTIPRE